VTRKKRTFEDRLITIHSATILSTTVVAIKLWQCVIMGLRQTDSLNNNFVRIVLNVLCSLCSCAFNIYTFFDISTKCLRWLNGNFFYFFLPPYTIAPTQYWYNVTIIITRILSIVSYSVVETILLGLFRQLNRNFVHFIWTKCNVYILRS